MPSPQEFLVKLRRGTTCSYVAKGGAETSDRDAAERYANLADARLERAAQLEDPEIDAAEVEIITP